MATELFHWQLYEMHFSGRNIYVLPIKYQCSLLTHRPLGDTAMILKMQSPNTFYGLIAWACRMKLLNATQNLWRKFNVGPDNGLVTLGNKKSVLFVNIYVVNIYVVKIYAAEVVHSTKEFVSSPVMFSPTSIIHDEHMTAHCPIRRRH